METKILYLFLAIAFVLAPAMTNSFFLASSRLYSDIHRLVFAILIVAVIFGFDWLALVWPIFCLFGFLFYLKKEGLSFSAGRVAIYLPFSFSVISSLWFVSGVLDLKLLGYDQTFSFYAALHGAYLGWIFVGCFAYLSQKTDAASVLYRSGAYLCFAFFLLVAFGINGIPIIKTIGTLGLSIIIPGAILLFVLRPDAQKRTARVLASLSLLAVLASMALALLNHWWPAVPRVLYDLPTMVLAHGTLNALVATPFFYWAVKLGSKEESSEGGVVFFDGFCVLCNGSVDLLLKLDTRGKLRCASLQGKFAKANLEKNQMSDLETVIFFRGGRIYQKSEAVIQILKSLGGLYHLMGMVLGILPFFVLDRFYDLVARNRYRLFGKHNECRIPTEETRGRILD